MSKAKSHALPPFLRRACMFLLLVTLLGGGLLSTSQHTHAAAARATSFAATSQSDPVLFIHGIDSQSVTDCNGLWGTALDYMRGDGYNGPWTGDLRTIGYYNGDTNCTDNIQDDQYAFYCPLIYRPEDSGTNNEPIENLSCKLAWYIYLNYSRYGQNVGIVAFSMGGLITRYALAAVARGADEFPPNLIVHDVVTLGTPHGGVAYLGDQIACGGCVEGVEMIYTSYFITVLKEPFGQNPQGQDGTDWSLIGSQGDLIDPTWVTFTYMSAAHQYFYIRPAYGHNDYPYDTVEDIDAAMRVCMYCGPADMANSDDYRTERHSLNLIKAALSSNDY